MDGGAGTGVRPAPCSPATGARSRSATRSTVWHGACTAPPALDGVARPADAHLQLPPQDGQQRRRGLELRRAQDREALDQVRRLPKEDVVAEVTFLGGEDDARRPCEGGVEARHPLRPAGRNAGPHEIVAVEGQHHVDLGTGCKARLDEQQVRAARGRRVHDRRVPRRAMCSRSAAITAETRDAGKRGAARPDVSSMCPVKATTSGARTIGRGCGGRQRTCEQFGLSSHARDAPGVLSGLLPGRRVTLARECKVATKQRRFRRGGKVPARERPTPRGQRGFDLTGERTRRVDVAQQHRQRRGVDTRIRIPRQCVGREILGARACREDVGVAPGRRTVQRVLPQPAALREDFALDPARVGAWRAPGTVEQRVRLARDAGPCMGQGAKEQPRGVAGRTASRLAERVARLPRSAAREQVAHALGLQRKRMFHRGSCARCTRESARSRRRT